MITTALVYFAALLIGAILLILSPFAGSNGFPAGVDAAVSALSEYIGWVDVFVPIDVLHTCVMFVIGFELTILTFKILRWLFSHVPAVGGK